MPALRVASPSSSNVSGPSVGTGGGLAMPSSVSASASRDDPAQLGEQHVGREEARLAAVHPHDAADVQQLLVVLARALLDRQAREAQVVGPQLADARRVRDLLRAAALRRAVEDAAAA